MIEEAAITAGYKLVEAENKIDVAKVAVEELDKMTKLAEETEFLMELAKEMHEQCKTELAIFSFFLPSFNVLPWVVICFFFPAGSRGEVVLLAWVFELVGLGPARP